MSYEWLAGIALVKVLAAFVVFFVVPPRHLFPQRPGADLVERFFDNLVMMSAVALVFVHLLALIGAYSIFALAFCYLLLGAALLWRRHRAATPAVVRGWWTARYILVLSTLDHLVDLRAAAKQRAWHLLAALRRWGDNGPAVVHAVLFVLILGHAASIRVAEVLRSAAFGSSDPYTHLLWMKQLQKGVLYAPSPAFVLEYYPRGFHGFLTILQGLTNLDGALTARVVGPLVGMLLVASVYYLGLQLTRNRDAALVGMAVYGSFVTLVHLLYTGQVGQDGGIEFTASPLAWFARQTTPLAQEAALVFLGPALFGAHGWLVRRDRWALRQFLLASLVVFFTHHLVGLVLVLGTTLLALLSVVLRASSPRTVVALAAAGAGVAVGGNLQVLYGLVIGHPGLRAVEAYYRGPMPEDQWPMPISLGIAASAVIGLLFVGVALASWRRADRRLAWALVGTHLLMLAFLTQSVRLGLRYVILPDRAADYAVFFLSGAAAGVYHLITLAPAIGAWHRTRRVLYQALCAVCLVGLAAASFPAGDLLPAATISYYEHEALARLSHEIKRGFPRLEWTIVSTVEDFSKVLGDGGWHINAEDFVSDYDPRATALPSPYVLLFVEKELFPRSSHSRLNRPGARLDVERRLHEWSSLYRVYHGGTSIYYEDDQVIVYQIRRPHDQAAPATVLAPRALTDRRGASAPIQDLAWGRP